MGSLISSHNILSEDLNFNCVMAAFKINDELDEMVKKDAFRGVKQILEHHGIEIVTYNKLPLSLEEAFHLRRRIIAANEEKGFSRRPNDRNIATTGHINPFIAD